MLTRTVVLWACRCPALGYVVPPLEALASLYCCRCAPRSGELILYYIVVFFYFFFCFGPHDCRFGLGWTGQMDRRRRRRRRLGQFGQFPGTD